MPNNRDNREETMMLVKDVSIVVNGGQVNIAKENGKIFAKQNNDARSCSSVETVKQKNKNKVFLSYCWQDEAVANNIYDFLLKNKDINLYRDKINIESWGSIREYMQSIPQMDFVVLLISDAYLKSENCMYEVLEVLRDRGYRNKILPAVIDAEIYKVETRVNYALYWQLKYKELKKFLQEIEIQNIGRLGEDLKRRQNIASSIAEFLDVIADMKNPEIDDVKEFILIKLQEMNGA